MSDCRSCPVETECCYEYKPCDCFDQRKFTNVAREANQTELLKLSLGQCSTPCVGPCATPDCNTGRVLYSLHCEEHTKVKDATIEKYTKNGEITFNTETKEYTVWDESYSDTVCVTNYPKVAEAALDAYAKHYL